MPLLEKQRGNSQNPELQNVGIYVRKFVRASL